MGWRTSSSSQAAEDFKSTQSWLVCAKPTSQLLTTSLFLICYLKATEKNYLPNIQKEKQIEVRQVQEAKHLRKERESAKIEIGTEIKQGL